MFELAQEPRLLGRQWVTARLGVCVGACARTSGTHGPALLRTHLSGCSWNQGKVNSVLLLKSASAERCLALCWGCCWALSGCIMWGEWDVSVFQRILVYVCNIWFYRLQLIFAFWPPCENSNNSPNLWNLDWQNSKRYIPWLFLLLFLGRMKLRHFQNISGKKQTHSDQSITQQRQKLHLLGCRCLENFFCLPPIIQQTQVQLLAVGLCLMTPSHTPLPRTS